MIREGHGVLDSGYPTEQSACGNICETGDDLASPRLALTNGKHYDRVRDMALNFDLLDGGVMKPTARTTHGIVWMRRMPAAALLLTLALVASLVSGQNKETSQEKQERDKTEKKRDDGSKPPVEKAATKQGVVRPPIVEVRYIDGSTMKLRLRDERIEFQTPYGKLLIPVRDIERIEFAFRIPEDVARQIDEAIADLGKTEFRRREAASAALLELRERAYPALLKAEKSADAEVARRARGLLEKIREEVPPEQLEFSPNDVVYTAGSKNSGRLAPASLKVHTFQFGEQQLKLADMRELRSPSATEAEPANALPDPGNLNLLMGQIGKVHTFRVTGVAGGGGGGMMIGGPGGFAIAAGGFVWGTDTYTLDSTLALAAVHAGVLKAGQTGVVRVKILGPQAGFTGSTRNGVTSMGFGPYNGSFQFVRGR
jgi:hypothetical protein